MLLQYARNIAVENAFALNCDYILWIDDDMFIEPGTKLFSRLYEHKKDIAAPLFFTRKHPYLPLLFKKKLRANGSFVTFDNIMDYEKGLVECDGVGFGCVLIKMDVFRKISKPYFLHGDTYGEDLYFCNSAITSGFKIYCDTNLCIGHIGDPPVIMEGNYNQHKDAAKLWAKQRNDNNEAMSKKYELKCDIVIPCYKNYEVSRECIESIISNTTGVDYRLILVNDGADRQLAKYFKGLKKYRKNVEIVTNKVNSGWVKAVNAGLKLCKAPYVLIANNDIVVGRDMAGWLFRMINLLMANKKAGAIGPTSNYVMGMQSVKFNNSISTLVHYSKLLIGFCMLVKKEVIDKIGFLDERFTLDNKISGNDDLDYSLKIRDAGYKLLIARDIFIFHHGSATLGEYSGNKMAEYDDKTREILVDKWGKKKVKDLFLIDGDFLAKGDD